MWGPPCATWSKVCEEVDCGCGTLVLTRGAVGQVVRTELVTEPVGRVGRGGVLLLPLNKVALVLDTVGRRTFPFEVEQSQELCCW